MLGLRIFKSKPFNPLTENEATISAGLIPSKVPWKSMEINKEELEGNSMRCGRKLAKDGEVSMGCNSVV